MIQHHLESCQSTTTELKRLIDESDNDSLLVSTSFQSAGHGRMGKSWLGLPNALALSFVVEANPTTSTLTSLEIGLAVSEFMRLNHQAKLSLKWPNDLLNSKREKVGGILLQNLKANLYICGIGINWSDPENKLSELERLPQQYPAGALFDKDVVGLTSTDKKEISFKLATYVKERIPKLRLENFTALWSAACIHIDHEVEIVDSEKRVRGIFKGIGQNGEALIQVGEEQLLKVYSGSLFIL